MSSCFIRGCGGVDKHRVLISCFCFVFTYLFVLHLGSRAVRCLTTEAVEGAALALEGVDDVKSSDGLAASVLSVGDSIADDVLKEHLQNTSGLLVDEAGDALDTTSACQTADGGLRDALDVVSEDLSVALSAALAQTFASFSATRHCC
jgi:hypothetical protein